MGRWDDLTSWDAHELLDTYGELRDRDLDDPNESLAEAKFLWVRDEILRRLAS